MLTSAEANASDLRKRRRIKWWWNVIGRTDEEIREAREAWMASGRFGDVKGFDGDRLPAPEVPATQLKARGRVR